MSKKDLTIWDDFSRPVKNFRNFFNDMDDFLKLCPAASNLSFSPKINFSENDKIYEISAELPGLDKKDIKLDIVNNTLIIKGKKEHEKKEEDKHYYRFERSSGEFYREIRLSKAVQQNKINAKFKDGVLHIAIHKEQDDSKSTKIKIE